MWHAKAGAAIKVCLTLSTSGDRHHVILTDPLPAGLEAINPDFDGEAPVLLDSGSDTSKWWRKLWYQHQAMRDTRVEAFSSYISSGRYDFSYFARATSIGHFAAPPAKAEEMYNPDSFGRTQSDRFVVE